MLVHQHLAKNHDVQVVETNERGHATRFAQDAAARGLDCVVAFGGDGTLNEVATGLAGSDTALAMLPGGSTNVFVRSLGIANEPMVALTQLTTGIERNEIERVSLVARMAATSVFTLVSATTRQLSSKSSEGRH